MFGGRPKHSPNATWTREDSRSYIVVVYILSCAPGLVIVCLKRVIWRIPLAELKLVILSHSEVRRLILGPFINMITVPNDATCSLCFRIHQLMKDEQQQENFVVSSKPSICTLHECLSNYGTYIVEYYSAIKRNTFESVWMRWMNLERMVQSRVSQKEKNKYHVLTRMYGI